ncbi:hypothetical protein MKW92_045818 [Papaver armeniacum]|nr:hypothetical protein MKW92_045818 [Papaver armeniacum]
MRIRKLITQKKISAPNLSYCNNRSSSLEIPSSCAAAATSTVSTTPPPPTTSSEEERVKKFQKTEAVGACELNMSVWDVTADDELLYYRKDEDVSKVIKNEDKEQEHYDDDAAADDDDPKITDESVNTEEYKISTERDDDSESEEDDEETEEELEEEQYATEDKGKLGLKSVMNENDDKKRKRDYEEYDQETEVYHEETEDEQENNKRKRESDYDYDTDYEVEGKKKKKRVVYCSVKDGKGWHCGSKAQTGNPLCKHHMVQKQQRIFRKLNKITTRIGRPPKETRTNTNGTTTIRSKLSGKNSSEFYYYSGFGPLWGRSKRGRPSNEVKKQPEEKLDEDQRKVVIEEALITRGVSPVKFKEENVNVKDNGCIMFVDDEFDDDYNTDEDCNGVNGKTKNRKPIKARSLNSLF